MADLEAVVREGMEALGIPGVAVAVVDRGEVAVVCAGVTSYDHPLPVTDTTIFQIGSISKTFCGMAAMALVDEGVLVLDEPVRRYVPDLRLSSDDLSDGVTMRHLLTHTTGWVGDYFGDTGQGDDALGRFVVKLAKAPQLTPLGETFSYNNSAFNLAAHVIATVTATPYERAVADLVLRPLGLGHTFYDAQDVIGQRIAIGHRGGHPQRWTRPRAHAGNGGVLSCVADLMTYARYHLGESGGAPVMSAGALEETHRPQHVAGSLCDDIGLPWFLDTWAGHRIVHHGGTTNGYQADLRLVPDRALAWVMLTNSDHNHQLDRMIREHLLGPDDDLAPFAPHTADEYAGRYRAVLAELDVNVDAGGGLTVGVRDRAKWSAADAPAPSVPTRLVFRDADRVQALDMPFTGHRGEFLRDDTGAITWFRWDGRLAERQR